MSFTTFSELASRALFAGVTGRYTHGERLTIGEVELAAGAVVPSHSHPHEQVTYVATGRIEFTVAGETRLLQPGMCTVIPGNTPHACRALDASRVLDVFAPMRHDLH